MEIIGEIFGPNPTPFIRLEIFRLRFCRVYKSDVKIPILLCRIPRGSRARKIILGSSTKILNTFKGPIYLGTEPWSTNSFNLPPSRC